MMADKKLGQAVLFGALLLAAGCSGLQVKYKPSTAAAPAPTTSVALQVVDGRPADKLQNKKEVGQVRNGVGIPFGLDDQDENVVPRTVTEATNDALKLAGLGTLGGQKRLVATVTEFWMDGFMGYKAAVTVRYALLAASGQPLWTQEVKGAAGGTSFGSTGPNSMAQKLFAEALTDLANKANAEFRSPQFTQALSM
jgi:hypothetical protein